MDSILTRDFYRRDTLAVARDLLGRDIVRVLEDGSQLVCRITEPPLSYHTPPEFSIWS